MIKWIANNKKSIIRGAFLVPILAVSAVSISHVVSWYDLANPISWAIYLSVAVELAAMSSIAAASAKVKGFSVWVVFIIVTLIQLVGNIYFSYSEIDLASKQFKDWSELTQPIFEAITPDSAQTGQRRLLALLEGGLLPLISLTCLHFFIQYGESETKQVEETKLEEDNSSKIDTTSIFENVNRMREEGTLDTPSIDDLEDEPSALAFSYPEYEEEEEELPEIESEVPSIMEDEYVANSPLLDLIETEQEQEVSLPEEVDTSNIKTIPGDGANVQVVKKEKPKARLYLDENQNNIK